MIVQNTDYIEGMESITVCPITSVLSAASVRVRLKANLITKKLQPVLAIFLASVEFELMHEPIWQPEHPA